MTSDGLVDGPPYDVIDARPRLHEDADSSVVRQIIITSDDAGAMYADLLALGKSCEPTYMDTDILPFVTTVTPSDGPSLGDERSWWSVTTTPTTGRKDTDATFGLAEATSSRNSGARARG